MSPLVCHISHMYISTPQKGNKHDNLAYKFYTLRKNNKYMRKVKSEYA